MAERGDFCRMPLRLVAKACAAICERSVLKFDFELQRIDVHISALPENQFRGGPCSLSGEGEIRERVEDDLWPHVQSTNRNLIKRILQVPYVKEEFSSLSTQ